MKDIPDREGQQPEEGRRRLTQYQTLIEEGRLTEREASSDRLNEIGALNEIEGMSSDDAKTQSYRLGLDDDLYNSAVERGQDPDLKNQYVDDEIILADAAKEYVLFKTQREASEAEAHAEKVDREISAVWDDAHAEKDSRERGQAQAGQAEQADYDAETERGEGEEAPPEAQAQARQPERRAEAGEVTGEPEAPGHGLEDRVAQAAQAGQGQQEERRIQVPAAPSRGSWYNRWRTPLLVGLGGLLLGLGGSELKGYFDRSDLRTDRDAYKVKYEQAESNKSKLEADLRKAMDDSTKTWKGRFAARDSTIDILNRELESYKATPGQPVQEVGATKQLPSKAVGAPVSKAPEWQYTPLQKEQVTRLLERDGNPIGLEVKVEYGNTASGILFELDKNLGDKDPVMNLAYANDLSAKILREGKPLGISGRDLIYAGETLEIRDSETLRAIDPLFFGVEEIVKLEASEERQVIKPEIIDPQPYLRYTNEGRVLSYTLTDEGHVRTLQKVDELLNDSPKSILTHDFDPVMSDEEATYWASMINPTCEYKSGDRISVRFGQEPFAGLSRDIFDHYVLDKKEKRVWYTALPIEEVYTLDADLDVDKFAQPVLRIHQTRNPMEINLMFADAWFGDDPVMSYDTARKLNRQIGNRYRENWFDQQGSLVIRLNPEDITLSESEAPGHFSFPDYSLDKTLLKEIYGGH